MRVPVRRQLASAHSRVGRSGDAVHTQCSTGAAGDGEAMRRYLMPAHSLGETPHRRTGNGGRAQQVQPALLGTTCPAQLFDAWFSGPACGFRLSARSRQRYGGAWPAANRRFAPELWIGYSQAG